MQLLIDGYNLINATGIPAYGHGIGSLERARLGLLRFLSEVLSADELDHTTVVFDAHHAPPGLPRTTHYHGLTVRFAARHETADELIEELIRAETSPRRLTVVSSDHAIQRAARRRKATAISSEQWYVEVSRRHAEQAQSPTAPSASPSAPPAPSLVPEEVAGWVERFGGEQIVEQIAREERMAKRRR